MEISIDIISTSSFCPFFCYRKFNLNFLGLSLLDLGPSLLSVINVAHISNNISETNVNNFAKSHAKIFTILQISYRFLPLGSYSIISITARQQSLDSRYICALLPVTVTMKALKILRGDCVCGWGR